MVHFDTTARRGSIPSTKLRPGIPCIGDADAGYGNLASVRRTVMGYSAAGLAGVMIGDQVRFLAN